MRLYHRSRQRPLAAGPPERHSATATDWYGRHVVLLAFDLDKTLLTDDYRLPDETLAAVRAARQRGHIVTVLTGRPLRAAKAFLDLLEIEVPHAVNHGSYVRNGQGEALRRMRLATAQVDALLEEHLDDATVEFSCVVDDVLYVRDPANERWDWVHAESRAVTRFQVGLGLAADKVVFHGTGRTPALDGWVARRHPDLLRYLWGDGYLEIVPQGGDKGSALEYIAGLLGVPRDQVVAFGDGLNDVTMLGWAGHAVAVGPDVHPDALAAADEHVDSPELGGVAAWLERNAL